MKLAVDSFEITEDEVRLTEAFRKGYGAKHLPLRRLGYPLGNWPGLKELLECYVKQNPGKVW